MFILCTKAYANPEYLFASQVGLVVCKQKNEELLSSMVASKPPKEGVRQEVTLMEVFPGKKEGFRVSVRQKSEHYGK